MELGKIISIKKCCWGPLGPCLADKNGSSDQIEALNIPIPHKCASCFLIPFKIH